MNKLETIKIINFRSCINTRVDLRANLSALIGANGAGKTNILNGILMLSKFSSNRRQIRDPEVLGDDNAHTTLEFSLVLDNIEVALKSDLYFEIDEASETVVYARTYYKKKNNKTWREIESILFDYPAYRNRSGGDSGNHFLEYYRTKNGIKDIDIKINIINYLSSMSYYSATQFSDPSRSPVSFELENERLVRSGTRSRTHELFLRDLHRAYEDGLPFEKFINIVGPDGLKLIDNVEFDQYLLPSTSYKILVNGTIQNIEKNKRVVVPSIKLEGLRLSFSQLSEGTFKSLALIFYIINDDKDLLIIEEPEVCVHHGLLSSLIELIKIQSKTKQIIISTHSDYVLDKLQPENVVFVSKDKNEGTLAAPLDKLLIKDDYAQLKYYLNNSGNLGEYWRESGFIDE